MNINKKQIRIIVGMKLHTYHLMSDNIRITLFLPPPNTKIEIFAFSCILLSTDYWCCEFHDSDILLSPGLSTDLFLTDCGRFSFYEGYTTHTHIYIYIYIYIYI